VINTLGRAGIIVPTGIATDFYTKDYFSDLVEKQQLVSLLDFENREGLFDGVHRSYKFCLLTINGEPVDKADFVFFATNVAHLRDKLRRFSLKPEEIARFNPNTHTMPVFRTRPDADLTRKVFENLPVFINENIDDGAPYKCEITRTFDMSRFGSIAKPLEYFRSKNGTLRKNGRVFLSGNLWIPIIESKTFWMLDHRFATYEGVSSKDTQKGNCRLVNKEEKKDPNFSVISRYWLPKSTVEKYTNWHAEKYWLGYRNITNNTNERTMVPSILPNNCSDYTVRLIYGEKVKGVFSSLLIGNLFSIAFDYVARQSVSGTNFSDYIMKQLPIINPECFTKQDIRFITNRILEIIFVSRDLDNFAIDIGYHGPPFSMNKERCDLLKAELDAYYARMYGFNRKLLRYILDPADLTPKELEDILDPWEEVADPLDPEGYEQRAAASTFPGETFRVLKEKEIRKYGEYRTRRLVLEAWERMQESIDTGMEYVPMVDPPPAHPSMAHPWPDGTPYEGPGLVLDESMFEEEKPEPKPAAKKSFEIHEPQPELPIDYKPEPINWDLYKCKGCGQILAGFARYEHVWV